jgi:hypothetical protein
MNRSSRLADTVRAGVHRKIGRGRNAANCLLPYRGTIRFGAVSKENLVGRTIAGYTLKTLVGEGGTSVVYRAEHPTNGQVAFKASASFTPTSFEPSKPGWRTGFTIS